FPEYLHMRFRVPTKLTYRFLRWFHAPARCVMAPTRSIKRDLEQRGFNNVVLWSRGVDTALFQPQPKSFLSDARPVFMYLGRVAAEKNIETFLGLDLPGTRYVVGDGPGLSKLKQKYPAVKFTGFKTGAELVRHLSAADVFVFPSRTDTFGLVLLEALACGVPVAAYPVAGPIDVIVDGVTGYLDEDLGRAALKALSLDGGICREHALHYTWEKSVSQFLGNLFIHEVTGASSYALPASARTRYTSLDSK
ncbi:MAG: glycosyltransferase, partial [Gammaproteobacteria bacterium]|nr:glycosyltransferase [Gammaproteobacteria bacterium]